MWKVKKKIRLKTLCKLTCIIYDPKPHPSKSDAQCWTFMPRYRCQKGLRTSIRSVLIMLLYSQCFAINHSLCWLSSTSLIEVKLLSVLIGNDISRDYVVVLASLFMYICNLTVFPRCFNKLQLARILWLLSFGTFLK